MKYVKTYELFGGWSKEARKRKLLAKQEELKKKEDQENTNKQSIIDKRKEDFFKSIKDYLLNLKNRHIENIDIDLPPGENGSNGFALLIQINKEDLKGCKLPVEEAIVNIDLHTMHDSNILYSQVGEEIIIYGGSRPTVTIKSKKIINSKGDLGETSEIKIPMFSPAPLRGMRGRPSSIVSLKLDPKGNSSAIFDRDSKLENIEEYLNGKIESVGVWINKYFNNRIKDLEKEESLAAFNKITEDEVKETLIDILDMCNGDYVCKKEEDHYKIHGKIPGLSTHSEKGLKMNSVTTQVIRHIPEIKDRLNDIGLDMDIHFGSVMKAYNIDIKVYGIGGGDTPTKTTRPAMRGPRRI